MSRIAIVDRNLCNPVRCNLECMRACPSNRLRKECTFLVDKKTGEKHIDFKYEYTKEVKSNSVAFIEPTLSQGCNICAKACPFHAIDIVNLPEAKEEERVFSYGKNAFSLYKLAIPKTGIVAIVGENGCGKSTNLKLIAGKLAPQKFPTKEIKQYFEKSNEKDLVYKPQEISALGEKRTVGQILSGIDEGNRLSELKAVFDLDKIYDREMEKLSGGELQKVVVVAALLKERETYFLDEPFSFLDYIYRIRLINYLLEKFSNRKVLIVDHDISLLSYLCKQSYLLFGEPSAYGIVSQVYATDRAINMFMEGHIGPENMRFREEAIAYRHYVSETHKNKLLEIPKLKAERGEFKIENDLQIPIFEGEIVGIAGKNGIGKSTFCREIFDRQGEGAAFKEQILNRENSLAGKYFQRNDLFSDNYIKAMKMAKLEFYDIRKLSGGELQKLEIFKTLNQQKPLYVLDEPTNMLDVRARIMLSKMMRERAENNCAIIVVDHDLEFLYNSVDRLLVMNGESGKSGHVEGIYEKEEGVSRLLSDFDLSYRRDNESKRLKLNKAGSKKDAIARETGKFIE
ncbi:ATP-binding cassette domain-containing protein [Candidatus Micrarchaeota archaeon]|nr:ATP-binding cassette domain-containing protein [Candidatus Micrarchaeota archaeon]